MGKIHRDKGECPQCGSNAIMIKQGRGVKAKGYHRERCTTCGYYLKKT